MDDIDLLIYGVPIVVCNIVDILLISTSGVLFSNTNSILLALPSLPVNESCLLVPTAW